jgi:hypothetical protein
MDPELMKAMQTYFMQGSPTPIYYGTGESPNPDAPELDPFAQNVFATGAPPNTDKKGNLLPYNLDYAKSLMNYQQDALQSVADPMNAYLASLFGGEGFAPGAFSQVDKTTPIELTQIPMLQQLSQTRGVNGILAGFMLGGDDYRTAVAKLRAGLNNPEQLGLTPDEVKALQVELPGRQNGLTGEPLDTSDPNNVDWNSITKDAQSMWQPLAQEQAKISAPGVTQDANGNYLSVEKVDSPQMEFIKKLGLPDPTAQYDLQWALENDPTVRGVMMQSATSNSAAENMRKTLGEYTKKLAKQREAESQARANDAQVLAKYRQGPLADWAAQGAQRAAPIQQAMSDYFRQATEAGAPIHLPNQDAINQRNQRMGQFQGQPTMEMTMPMGAPTAAPTGPQFGEGEAGGMTFTPGWKAGAGPALGGLQGVGAPPAPPELSIYGRNPGMTADDVAALFNKATSFLPNLIKPDRAVTSAARDPLRKVASVLNKKSAADQTALFQSMIPYMTRQRQGRTPAKDVVQQRLLPLYASGAYGQQGMPSAYPTRDAITAALFGG